MDTWVRWIGGLLVAAFLAWAGVVWNTGQSINSALQSMELRIGSQLTKLEERQIALRAETTRHQTEPAHGNVLLLITRIEGELKAISERAAQNRDLLREIQLNWERAQDNQKPAP